MTTGGVDRKDVRGGMTLVELLVSLTVVAILSTAVFVMLHGGAQVYRSIDSSITSQWEVEAAVMRMVQAGRTCSSLTVPTGVSGGTAFSLVTEPDPGNGGLTYAVSYQLVTASDGTNQLVETDARYGSSVLLHNVQSFDVRTKNAGFPQVVIMTMTVGQVQGVVRTVRITPRNQ